MTRNNPHNIGYWYQPKVTPLPTNVLWDRWRKAWEQNQQYHNSYARPGHQPLPVKAIEKFEDLKLATTNP